MGPERPLAEGPERPAAEGPERPAVAPPWAAEPPPGLGDELDLAAGADLGAGALLLVPDAKEFELAKPNASDAPTANTRPELNLQYCDFIEFSILG